MYWGKLCTILSRLTRCPIDPAKGKRQRHAVRASASDYLKHLQIIRFPNFVSFNIYLYYELGIPGAYGLARAAKCKSTIGIQRNQRAVAICALTNVSFTGHTMDGRKILVVVAVSLSMYIQFRMSSVPLRMRRLT